MKQLGVAKICLRKYENYYKQNAKFIFKKEKLAIFEQKYIRTLN